MTHSIESARVPPTIRALVFSVIPHISAELSSGAVGTEETAITDDDGDHGLSDISTAPTLGGGRERDGLASVTLTPETIGGTAVFVKL